MCGLASRVIASDLPDPTLAVVGVRQREALGDHEPEHHDEVGAPKPEATAAAGPLIALDRVTGHWRGRGQGVHGRDQKLRHALLTVISALPRLT